MKNKVKKYINTFLNRNWSPSSLNELFMMINQTGIGLQTTAYQAPSVDRARRIVAADAANQTMVKSVRRGFLRTLIIDSVEELASGPDNSPDTHKTGIFKTSEHRIVKHELKIAMRSCCVVNFIFSVVYFGCQ